MATNETKKGSKPEGPELPEGPWDRLWVQLVRSPWTSVAIVPASAGLEARDLASALARVGSDYRGRTVSFLDACGVSRASSRDMVQRVEKVDDRHGLVVAVDAPTSSQTALLVARAADAAVVAVGLEATALEEVRRTIELLGRDKVLGAVTVGPATTT